MNNPTWNNVLPVTKAGKIGVSVPLDQAILNPKTVLNITPKTYLPTPANQLPQSNK